MQTEGGAQAIHEVEHLLMAVKSEFADFQVSQCVVTFIKGITGKVTYACPQFMAKSEIYLKIKHGRWEY